VTVVADQRTIDGAADADFLDTIVQLFKEWGLAL
jgi:pyruvate/2-oxoglutarate dehydrogenase complex dihydrolipoamide acyltransferase (E2) component